MLDTVLRETKDLLLAPLARSMRLLHPTTVTFIALGFGLLAGVLLVQQQYIPALIAWWLNRIFDGLDGVLARLTHRQSDLGGYLDIMFDFLVYALVPITLVVGAPSFMKYMALAFLLATFYVNSASWMYLSAILEKRKQGAQATGEQTTITMPVGLVGGTETIILFTLFILWPQQVVTLFTVMSVMVIITIGQRLHWAMRHLT